MPLGIANATNVTFNNITAMANFTGDPGKFLILGSHIMFNGWFWFIMLLLTWIILYKFINDKFDQPLNNIMYSGVVVSIASFFLRGMNIVHNGILIGMLTDFQLWIIPLITSLFAGIIWFIKD